MIEIESQGVPIKAWVEGVPVEDDAKKQLRNVAKLPIVWPHVAVLPDVHLGIGATVGSVIPTERAIIPAAVGVDLGCGVQAVRTSFVESDLPDSLASMRSAIEAAIPHGRTNNGGSGDRGAWGSIPGDVDAAWRGSRVTAYDELCARHPKMRAYNTANHLGTLGTGNHFVEVCLDEGSFCPRSVPHGDGTRKCACHGVSTPVRHVWVMLHSGSRGVGNKIGSYFIELAKNDMRAAHGNLPEDQDLAYLTEGTQHFIDYVAAVGWAQDFARVNREIMMARALDAISKTLGRPVTRTIGEPAVPIYEAVQCHHNYVQREEHFGRDLWVTRKGAVSARAGELGIIPGSMGAKSFIVRGKGNADSLHSCSHGAGRSMSRNAAKKAFTLADHAAATAGVECRKDEGVIDETPGAYKAIDDVMRAQSDLVEVVATLKQVLCVKG
jgi:tRNA-splicing ligase RtcB